jgi:aryl-phospho-beta-D-glucosidase BglC (GH1 family)
MKKMYHVNVLILLVAIASFFSCKSDDVEPLLSVSVAEVTFSPLGDTTEITIVSNDTWNIGNSASAWLKLSPTSGNSGTATVQVIGLANGTRKPRSSELIVRSNNGQARNVKILQGLTLYPSYNTSPKAPDATGMSSTAAQLAAKMKLGWNIGNTLEAPGGETAWGNPMITEDYIKFVKESGFNAIRLHVDNEWTAHIDQNWMNRVKEVVNYCVKNDMYVLLNIHWDGGWLDEHINREEKDSINAKQKAYWEQIATAMRDFDEHLMFASANEPPVETAIQMEVLTSYHQTFIDAVRSTGGRNSYRVLVIQGPSTDISKTYDLMTSLPLDKVNGRLMVEIHNYTPYQFTLMNGDADWGRMFYYWGANYHSSSQPDRNAIWGEENVHIEGFQQMKTMFVDKGIPVIMGEYGAYRRNNGNNIPTDLEMHNNAVDYWTTFVTKQALAHGVIPFWWDTGGALDRAKYTVKDQRTIDAIIAGSK